METIEVDISGLIGKTDVATVIAFSNSMSWSLLIPARVKRIWLYAMRKKKRSSRHIYLHLYVASLFLLLRQHIDEIGLVVLDVEFDGYEGQIRHILSEYLRKIRPEFSKEQIVFHQIGKKSRAHHKALSTWRGHIKPDAIVMPSQLFTVTKQK